LVIVLFFVVGPAFRVALRSPKGEAFRAKRRAGLTTPAPRSPLIPVLAAALLVERPLAMDGYSAAGGADDVRALPGMQRIVCRSRQAYDEMEFS